MNKIKLISIIIVTLIGQAFGLSISIGTENTVLLQDVAVNITDTLSSNTIYDISVNISGNTGGLTNSVFFWGNSWTGDSTIYFAVSNGETYQLEIPSTFKLYAFFADNMQPSDNTASGVLTFTKVDDQDQITVPITTDNTVFLEDVAINLTDTLSANTNYDVSVNISGNTGGLTKSVFFWGNSWTGDSTKYFAVSNGETYRLEIPSTFKLYAFFADNMQPSDNTASGVLTFTKDDNVGITDNSLYLLPKTYTLFQNYPNPFNPTTTISYQLPQSELVNVSIYNVAGQLVETLVSEHKNVGYHSVIWNASGIASGLYFYRINAGEYTEIKKCMILK